MDEIIGVAILTRTKPQELVIACRKSNGGTFLDRIPVYAPGESKPAEHAWQYQIAGEILNVTPSVHIRYQLPQDKAVEAQWITRFHNGFNWSVRFQWASGVEPGEVWEEAKAANPDIRFTNDL